MGEASGAGSGYGGGFTPDGRPMRSDDLSGGAGSNDLGGSDMSRDRMGAYGPSNNSLSGGGGENFSGGSLSGDDLNDRNNAAQGGSQSGQPVIINVNPQNGGPAPAQAPSTNVQNQRRVEAPSSNAPGRVQGRGRAGTLLTIGLAETTRKALLGV